VLERSARGGPPRTDRPWSLGSGAPLVFRDRVLSNRLAFEYTDRDGVTAAAELLAEIAGRAVTPLALDGENPWEAFPDAGAALLTALFRSGRITTWSAVAERSPLRLDRLHTGSWINADLAVWTDSPQGRQGWRHLRRVRAAWEAAGRPAAAWPHLSAAEGSDWLWWADIPRSGPFEALFRAHLDAAWRVISPRGG